jgi:preprotein translocase subunit SecG
LDFMHHRGTMAFILGRWLQIFFQNFADFLQINSSTSWDDAIHRGTVILAFFFIFVPFLCNFSNSYFSSSNFNSLGIFHVMTLKLTRITYNGPKYILKISYKFL